MVLSGVLISGSCWLSAADEAPSTGLRGILPNAAPSDLTATIAELPDNWKDWGTAVSAELATLYEKEGVDVAGQRAAIAALRGRQATVAKHAADPRYRPILNQLVSLSGGLKRRLDTASAALDTLERGPEIRGQKISSARQPVIDAARNLENYLVSIRNGAGWSKYLQVSEVRGAVAGSDPDKTAATLSAVQKKLAEKGSLADAKARDFLARPQFAAYEQAIGAYLTAVAAPAVPGNNPELRKNLAELVGALEQYEETHASAASAAVRKAFDAVRGTSPDGGDAFSRALRNNYFNYNVRVVASEGFLNKFVGQSRNEAGPVRDFILGADVYGNQTTHTDVSIDLIPSGRTAQFDLVARGAVASNTQGITDQATVYTSGNHYFTAAKRIFFDGEKFWTQPGRIGVSANNTTTGADTNINIPFFRGFADRIAVRRAEGLRGESEAIAASRVQDRVLPQFNSEVDKEFGPNGKTNSQVGTSLNALRELNLYPDAKSWSTTDTELKLASRLMTSTELGGGEPSPALVLGRGATILLHESAMNNAADRLELAGKTMTEDEVQAKLESNFSKLLDREVKFKRKEKTETTEEDTIRTFVFDKADPIRVAAENGTLTVTLRAGFQQEGKEDIPTQIVTVPVTFSVDAKNVVIEPGDVSVAAAEPPESAAKQLTRAGVIKKKITSAFPRTEVDRVRYVTREKKKVLVAVTRIRALDGWLSITVE
ncbi:MAG: hypothetical protein ACM3U2_04015 [Deltaproteobacteria bacterium]